MYSTLACVPCGGKEAGQDGWEDVHCTVYSTLASVQCGGKEAEQDGWEDVLCTVHLPV